MVLLDLWLTPGAAAGESCKKSIGLVKDQNPEEPIGAGVTTGENQWKTIGKP